MEKESVCLIYCTDMIYESMICALLSTKYIQVYEMLGPNRDNKGIEMTPDYVPVVQYITL